jgi:hypothetical protein
MDVIVVLSATALVVVNLLIWKPRSTRRRIRFLWILAGVVLSPLYLASPLLMIQALGTALGIVGLSAPRYGRTTASVATVAACLGAWGFMGYHASDHWRKIDALRAEYPFVSLEDRLPAPHFGKPSVSVDMTEGERAMPDVESFKRKAWYFEMLHNERAKSFARTPGFGPSRMVTPLWMKSSMRQNTESPEPIPQPGVFRDEIEPTGDAMPDAKVRDFFGFHASSIGSFINFKGFGYLKSRREVAGFTPHVFEREPKPAVPYTLERLELVGLVRNPEPAVYVSEFLPRMVELETMVTRPADGFEAAGLKKLAAGEDLVANAVGPKVRLLGAIRNMTACVDCHGGRRGDLLGAFSYRLAETK